MSNKITKEQVEHVAKLAKLELTESEVAKFTEQLGDVIDYNVNLLNQVRTDEVEPLYQVTGETNRMREDEASPSLSQDQVLLNGGSVYNGFFKVKAVIEE